MRAKLTERLVEGVAPNTRDTISGTPRLRASA